MTPTETNRLANDIWKQIGKWSTSVHFIDSPTKPLGSSYVPLPKVLANKKAIVNMKNDDNECFKWSVTAAAYPRAKNAERISKKLRVDAEKFDWTGIEFPITLRQIDLFEKNNETYSINVIGYEDGKGTYLLRKSENVEGQFINLLLITLPKSEGRNHYCWIKNLSRLLSAQISKHDGKRYFCNRCLISFQSDESLRKHERKYHI